MAMPPKKSAVPGPVAAALVSEGSALNTSKFALEDLIYEVASEWIGSSLSRDKPLALLRVDPESGEQVVITDSAHTRVTAVIEAAQLRSENDLRARVEVLSNAADAVLHALELCLSLDIASQCPPQTFIFEENSWKKSILAHGAGETFVASGKMVLASLHQELAATKEELQAVSTPGKRGKKEDIFRNTVALELARLFVYVTGVMPTFGGIQDGKPVGQYCRALVSVFELLQARPWVIAGPVRYVQEQLTEAKFEEWKSTQHLAIGALFGGVFQENGP